MELFGLLDPLQAGPRQQAPGLLWPSRLEARWGGTPPAGPSAADAAASSAAARAVALGRGRRGRARSAAARGRDRRALAGVARGLGVVARGRERVARLAGLGRRGGEPRARVALLGGVGGGATGVRGGRGRRRVRALALRELRARRGPRCVVYRPSATSQSASTTRYQSRSATRSRTITGTPTRSCSTIPSLHFKNQPFVVADVIKQRTHVSRSSGAPFCCRRSALLRRLSARQDRATCSTSARPTDRRRPVARFSGCVGPRRRARVTDSPKPRDGGATPRTPIRSILIAAVAFLRRARALVARLTSAVRYYNDGVLAFSDLAVAG